MHVGPSLYFTNVGLYDRNNHSDWFLRGSRSTIRWTNLPCSNLLQQEYERQIPLSPVFPDKTTTSNESSMRMIFSLLVLPESLVFVFDHNGKTWWLWYYLFGCSGKIRDWTSITCTIKQSNEEHKIYVVRPFKIHINLMFVVRFIYCVCEIYCRSRVFHCIGQDGINHLP